MKNEEQHSKIKGMGKSPEKAEEKSAGRKAFGLFLIFILLVFLLFVGIFPPPYVELGPGGGSKCSLAEQDAKNVIAAIASYFSEPENKRMPTLAVLKSEADLSLNNPAANVSLYPVPGTLVQDYSLSGPGAVVHSIRVRIVDASGRCPRNNAYVSSLGGGMGYWE